MVRSGTYTTEQLILVSKKHTGTHRLLGSVVMASPMITTDPEINTHKRKRVDTVYDVAPLMAPIGYVPWFASTLENAERHARYLENHYRNHFDMTLDWDEMDPERHISVNFAYAPSYLYEFGVTARDV